MRRWGLALLILLLAFGLRMVHLQCRPLWYDEAFAVLYASLSPERMIYGTVTPVEGAGAADVHPLFYYSLLHGWMGLAGRSPLAVRFFSVGLGMVTVALLWRLAAWCFDRQTGLVVGLLAAVNPFHVAYSQETRMYALLGLATVAATWGLLRALEEGSGIRDQGSGSKKWWWFLYAVAAALTLYAHNLGAFVLLSLNLLAGARRSWRQRLRTLALANLVAFALFSPWMVAVLPGQVSFVKRGYWLAVPGIEELIRAVMMPVLTFYEPAPLSLLGLGLFACLLCLSLLFVRVWQARSRAGWFLLLCWAPVLSLMLVSLWRPLYLERALLPSALFCLVAIGWLLVRGELPLVLCAGLAAFLAVTMAVSLAVHFTYARFPRPPFSRLAVFLQDRVNSGEIVVHDNKLTFFPTYYYAPAVPQAFCPDLPGSGSDTLALPTQEALGLFATPISRTVTSDVEGVWYVAFDRTWEEYRALGYNDAPSRAWLRAHCWQERQVQTIADLEIYHFVDCEVEP